MDRLIALVLLRWQAGAARRSARARARGRPAAGAARPAALLAAAAPSWPTSACAAWRAADPELLLPRALGGGHRGRRLLGALAAADRRGARRDPRRVAAAALPVPLRDAGGVVAAREPARSPWSWRSSRCCSRVALALAGRPLDVPAGRSLGVAARASRFILAAAQVGGPCSTALSRNRRLHDLALFLGLGLGFVAEPAARAGALGAACGRWARCARALRRAPTSSRSRPSPGACAPPSTPGRGDAARAFALAAAAGGRDRRRALAVSAVLIQRIYRGELDLGRRARRPRRRRARACGCRARSARCWRRTCAWPGATPR